MYVSRLGPSKSYLRFVLASCGTMIFDLERWSAPPVLMLLCLLLVFNEKVERTSDVQFVEVFAGKAEISKAMFEQGLVGSAHDIRYSSHFDLCGTVGFL